MSPIESNQEGRLELQIVQDIIVDGAFDDTVSGVTHITHIASPLLLNPQSVENDLLIPAIKGEISIHAPALLLPTLKSVVITSSFAAAFDPKHGPRPIYIYSSKCWDPITYSEAADLSLDPGQCPGQWRPWNTYLASKKLAEEAVWKLYEQHHPRWNLSTILPTYIGRPTVLPLTEKHGSLTLTFSAGLICKIAIRDGDLPKDDFAFWVDIEHYDVDAKSSLNALNLEAWLPLEDKVIGTIDKSARVLCFKAQFLPPGDDQTQGFQKNELSPLTTKIKITCC
ncbi:aldehyde reductase II [Penicillium atrosanguineum]|nr:aldehyde reductase II [Penicillium atrosanguineum]